MWIYISTVLLSICVLKFVNWLRSALRRYREICKCLSHFPLPVDNHWFYGVVHLLKDADDYFKLIQATVIKLHPKAVAYWLTWLRPGIVLVHPEAAKVVLQASHFSCPKTKTNREVTDTWIGDSLPVCNGAKWARMRKLLAPAFHINALKSYVKIYNDVTDLFLDKIKILTVNGESIDAYSLVSRATLDNVLRCSLSYVDEGIQSTDINCQHKYIETLTKMKDILLRRFFNPLLFNETIFSFTSDGKDMKRCTSYLHDFSDNLIQQRRASLRSDPTLLKKRQLDFLDILLTAKDETGAELTNHEVRNELVAFTFAGHDTTASAISWTLYALAKYPNFQKQVRDEVNDILVDRTTIHHEDLPKFAFTSRVIKETLRMFTPIPFILREIADALVIDGVTIPIGTEVDVSLYSIHHHPDVWENPETFDPDRFLPENIEKKDPLSFIPFSAGQRNCIGQHFAMDEIKVFVARVIRQFEISLDTNKPAERHVTMVAAFKDGLYLYFSEL